jgi:hypothetical protein
LALVIQILLLLLILTALISAFLSIKNWHWAQMLLMLGIVLAGTGALLLSVETLRTHRALRSGLSKLETEVASLEDENSALRHGTRDPAVIGRMFPDKVPFDQEAEGRMPSLSVWNQRLGVLSRQRGRVWKGVAPAGPVDPATGSVPVMIPEPRPHNLNENAIVYAFEAGPPSRGAAYLGEFRVTATSPEGATLQSVLRLDNRTGGRLARSQGPWRLYETMPADRHELFAGKEEAELRKLLPPETVQQYVRHGTPASPDDDEFHRAGFDENGRRLGPEDADKAVEQRYDRPLRDYAFLFGELARERVMMLADRAALQEDIQKLTQAQATAEKLSAHRQAELTALASDLERVRQELSVIQTHRDEVVDLVTKVKGLVQQALQYNSGLASLLADQQMVNIQ